MNILLWILQVGLALLFLAGGAYKLGSSDALATQFPALPRAGWRALGALEVLGGLLLVIPAAVSWMPVLTPVAAIVLAVESLAISAIYAKTSVRITASNPLVWSVVMAVLVAFVAYGRFVIVPLG